MTKTTTMSRPWRITCRHRAALREMRGRSSMLPPLVLVVDPVAGGQECDRGEYSDDDQQEPGQRRGVAHAEVFERLDVEIEGIEERRIDRPAATARNDEGRCECLEGFD